MKALTYVDVQRVLDQPLMDRLTGDQVRLARLFLGLTHEEMGRAWGSVRPDLIRTRGSVINTENSEYATRELSQATKILLARHLAEGRAGAEAALEVPPALAALTL